MTLESILRRLQSLLNLKPVKKELFLDIVNHDGLAVVAAIVAAVLGGGIGTFKLEVLVLLLQVLLAVQCPEQRVRGVDLVGVGENLVSRDDVLFISSVSNWLWEIHE